MTTITREEQLAVDTKLHFTREQEDAVELWQYIGNEDDGIPQDEELAEYFQEDGGYFDAITWINSNCLEANSRELLLATGGPAYGAVMIQNHPYFWFQDWFVTKQLQPFTDDAVEFYTYIFEYLEELTYEDN